MKTMRSDMDGTRVAAQLREHLAAFRAKYPREQIGLGGTAWSYRIGGEGAETLLILPGGDRIGDIAFRLFQEFAHDYRCLYPAYPPLSTMGALVEGLSAMLDRLAIAQVLIFAPSFGGDVGQCFVRAYPDRVRKLILQNTGVPDEPPGRAATRVKPLVTLLPLGVVRFLIGKRLGRVLAARPEERSFWRVMLREEVASLTRADVVSTFEETIDYRLHYHFSSTDLAAWPGKVLILQSDDDPTTKPAMRAALRALYPQAQVHTFHRAGHTPSLSQPDVFYPRVRAFLQES